MQKIWQIKAIKAYFYHNGKVKWQFIKHLAKSIKKINDYIFE